MPDYFYAKQVRIIPVWLASQGIDGSCHSTTDEAVTVAQTRDMKLAGGLNLRFSLMSVCPI